MPSVIFKPDASNWIRISQNVLQCAVVQWCFFFFSFAFSLTLVLLLFMFSVGKCHISYNVGQSLVPFHTIPQKKKKKKKGICSVKFTSRVPQKPQFEMVKYIFNI